jgi:hypothetical protein
VDLIDLTMDDEEVFHDCIDPMETVFDLTMDNSLDEEDPRLGVARDETVIRDEQSSVNMDQTMQSIEADTGDQELNRCTLCNHPTVPKGDTRARGKVSVC